MRTSNPLRRLTELGQSVWLDYIERGFVQSGDLARLIEDDSVSGLTSNPAIFQKAIAGGRYDDAVAALARDRLEAHEIHEALVIDDIRAAADVLAPVYARSQRRDGYVSLEVTPHLAHDEEGSVAEAKRLAALVNRPNLMVKVPGTAEGVPAIRRLTAAGLNINVTLLFSVERYAAAADAYVRGLEERAAAGQPIDGVASVASFFISRIDTLVDERLGSHADADLPALRGQSAIAFARLAYQRHRQQLEDDRWRKLAERGARPQRLLWASTGTKNPAYSDVKYVEALVARDTITTLPVETLIAYRDHGDPAPRLEQGFEGQAEEAAEIMRRLTEAGLPPATIAAELEADGVRKFIEPHDETLAALRERIAKVRSVSREP